MTTSVTDDHFGDLEHAHDPDGASFLGTDRALDQTSGQAGELAELVDHQRARVLRCFRPVVAWAKRLRLAEADAHRALTLGGL